MALTILSPLHRATRQVAIALEEAINDAGLDLGAEEGHALSYVAAYGPCPTGEVQRVLGVPRSTLTSLVDRLIKRGLFERMRDAQDGRVILVDATRKGAALAAKAERIAEKLEARIADGLTKKDREALARIVAAIDAATGVTVVDRDERKESNRGRSVHRR